MMRVPMRVGPRACVCVYAWPPMYACAHYAYACVCVCVLAVVTTATYCSHLAWIRSRSLAFRVKQQEFTSIPRLPVLVHRCKTPQIWLVTNVFGLPHATI